MDDVLAVLSRHNKLQRLLCGEGSSAPEAAAVVHANGGGAAQHGRLARPTHHIVAL